MKKNKLKSFMWLCAAALTSLACAEEPATIESYFTNGTIRVTGATPKVLAEGEVVLAFTDVKAVGEIVIDPAYLVTADALVVGGGGNGGEINPIYDQGGDGGDAGEVKEETNVSLKRYLVVTVGDTEGESSLAGSVLITAKGGKSGSSTPRGKEESINGSAGSGVGIRSSITGEEKLYGVGGAGGLSGAGAADGATAAANSGSGGGGAGAGFSAGIGGAGVVIVRVKAVEKRGIPVPTPETLTYNKEAQAALTTNDKYIVLNEEGSCWQAVDAGSYTAKVKPVNGYWWLDAAEESAETLTREIAWSIAPLEIEKPTATPAGFTYDGSEHTVTASTHEAYTYIDELTTLKATHAGVYTLAATLVNPPNATNYVWAGDSDYSQTANGYWRIASITVPHPALEAEFVYTGDNHVAVTLGEHMHLEDVYEGHESVTNATEVGTYQFRIVLDNDEGASDYVWADVENPTAADWLVAWRVKRADNELTVFDHPGWRIEPGVTPPTPTVTARFGEVTLKYAAARDADETEWTSEVPSTPGTWWVRATVPGTNNYTALEEKKSFFLWAGAGDIFTDSVEITFPGYTATKTITNFVVPVRLSEAAMPGFQYARVGGAEGLAFMIGDTFLDYDVEVWNPNGESLIWVKIPSFTKETSITMWWNGANGPTIAGTNAKAVWSDYVGVWHMNDGADAAGKNATGLLNSRDKVYEGLFGRALGARETGRKGAILTIPSGEALNGLSKTEGFTISMWVKPSSEATNWAYLFSRKTDDNDPGWGLQFRGAAGSGDITGLSLYADKTYNTWQNPGLAPDTWTRVDATYTNDKRILWINGVSHNHAWPSPIDPNYQLANPAIDLGIGGFAGTATSTGHGLFSGEIDEVRIRKWVPSGHTTETGNAEILAEIAAETDPAFSAKGLVSIDGEKENVWVKTPTLSPTLWDVADVASGKTTVALDLGALKEGDVKVTYYRYEDPSTPLAATTPEEITSAGRYLAVFTMVDPTGYRPISHSIEFSVVVHVPYTDLATGDLGRVLLLNRDENEKAPVDFQGYYDTTSDEKPTYWVHNPDKIVELENQTMNLMAATESVLKTAAGETLWTLKECRQGNVFPNEAKFADLALPKTRAYLPWNSPTAKRFDGRAELALTRSGAGTIVMRNNADAEVVSPRFAEGIGTIYFDAVNNRTAGADETGENYRLAVELETGDGTWSPVEAVTVYKKDGTDGFVSSTVRGDELALAITTGGTSENFYRFAVTLNTTKPTRFRIVRLSYDELYDEDDGALISLDNIIVSYPPMRADLEPTGFCDETKRGKDVLGWELVTTIPYPKVGDELLPRAKVVTLANTADGKPIDPATFVASAILRYRWRYLGQAYDPADGWKAAALTLGEDGYLVPTQALDVPAIVGDVEFYYESLLSAPYYSYVDYTGLALGVPTTEEVDRVTNRRAGEVLPSGGTDWFFRLRPGASKYEAIKLIVERLGEEGYEKQQEVSFEATGDRQWRAFLKTLLEDANTTNRFSIVALEPKDPTGEDPTLVTNFWKAIHSVDEVPVAVTFDKASETDRWARLVPDASTGYLMLQLNEDTKTISFTHADYQNFNAWNDAHRSGGVFVGSSTLDESKVGVDETARDFTEDFATAIDTPTTDQEWKEDFTGGTLETYQLFQSAKTPNGWQAKQGQFVNQTYENAGSGYAFQMVGQGYGELEYPGLTRDPRGLESISYRARVGQRLSFGDFAYMNAGARYEKQLTNYTVVTQFAMSDHGWTSGSDRSPDDFDGAGQVSLIGAYSANRGCYELRVTRTAVATLRLDLYKWRENKATLIHSYPDYNITTFHKYRGNNTAEWEYGTLFMSVDKQADGVRITAGISTGHSKMWTEASDTTPNRFTVIRFYDDTDPHTYGTYGVGTANCPALFLAPRVYAASVDWNNAAKGSNGHYTNTTIVFNKGEEGKAVAEEIADWVLPTSRLESFSDTERRIDRWGLKAVSTPQKLLVQLKAKNEKADWQTVAESQVSGFSLANKVIVPVYRPDDATFRLIHGGTSDDPRIDIVVDDVELRQWRGTDYGNYDTTHKADDGYGWRNEFVYTSAWIKNQKVKLSAKRTIPGTIGGLRSPLLDGLGTPKRGLGLGMISFSYENAQENARLLVQVATNVTGTAKIDESKWSTVDTIDFAMMSADERASGVISRYLGLHEAQGMIRLIVDPSLVSAVQNETNTRRFGEVDIRDILVRDEPRITTRSWWGWNIRLINGDESSAWDDGSRIYLPDWGTHAGDRGFSLALNNSVTANVIREEAAAYTEHMPFVQTPTLVNGTIGEISFKARLFEADADHPAEIRLYGTTSDKRAIDESDWNLIADAHFIVTNTLYETYRYRSAEKYRAIRLAVTGVEGVKDGARGPEPDNPPVSRVMIDEVVVGEAVLPRVGFRYVYPVRTGLDDHTKSPAYDEANDAANCDEQPLLGENWSVQAEVQVKQLPDEIDLERPMKVFFHWIENTTTTPWGFKNWCDLADAHVAELQPIDGERMIFRGSFVRTPSAVVAESAGEGTIVQYMARVVYYNKEGRELEAELDKNEWIVPEWFNPVNPNALSRDFAAFTILETISPHRAWINEVNVFDGYDDEALPAAAENQFIELAVPANQSLDGWRLEYVDSTYETYTLCVFGQDDVNASVITGPTTNDYTFLVIRSPDSENGTMWKDAKRIDGSAVAFDGTWSDEAGELDYGLPVALRLVRPSDVVAQEIVFMGDNLWKDSPAWAELYSAEPFAKDLNEGRGGYENARFYVVGDEMDNDGTTGPSGRSLGVAQKIGATKADWNNTMRQTPGWVNAGQSIPKNYVIYPNSALIVLRAILNDAHLSQQVGDREATKEEVKLTIMKDGEGAKIVYTPDPWYELASLTTNGVAVAAAVGQTNTFEIVVGERATKNIEVVAATRPWSKLAEYGFDPEGGYAEAIMAWLSSGRNYFGESFTNPGRIAFAEYYNLKGEKERDLGLEEMYYLDIDPTDGNWRLIAGIKDVGTKAKAASKLKLAGIGPSGSEGSAVNDEKQNLVMTVKMTLTNLVSNVSFAPYILRSKTPDKTSVEHHATATTSWSSVSFKVTGDLQNDNPNRVRWVPLRWFYFLPDPLFDLSAAGLRQHRSASFDLNHEAVIEIWDPFEKYGAGVTDGWDKYRGTNVFYSWAIDGRNMPTQIETLAPDSTF